MPVRRASKRSGNIIGHFPSLKLHRMVAFESTLARDYLYLLDYDPLVLTFEEQPLAIPYEHKDKARHYTPDFLLRFATRLVLIECKPTIWMDDQDSIRIDAARAWCAEHRYTFQVVTEQEVRVGHRLDNIKLLTRYARHPVAVDIRARIDQALATLPVPVTLADLARFVDPDMPSAAAASIFHLAFHHHLTINLDTTPLDGSSLIGLPSPHMERSFPR